MQQWDPDQIDEVAEAATQRARTSRDTAQQLRNLSVFATWKGDASDAAQQAVAHSSTKLDMTASEAFAVAVGAARNAKDVRSVKNEVNDLLAFAAESPAVEIDTMNNTVTAPAATEYRSEEDQAAIVAKMQAVEDRIVSVLAHAEEADADLASVLTAATGGDVAGPAEQGSADGASMSDGQLTPEESQRLAHNTTLTPEQQAALARGTLVLPASQMEYLNQLSRSLDGKSPAEINAMMGKLGPSGGRLADALQLVSNEHVSTSGVDPAIKPGDAGYVPARGSMDALPSGLRDAAMKYPLQWQDTKSMGMYPQARQELRDLAAIVDRGNPALQQGSTLDRQLLKQSEIMLNESKVPSELSPFVKGQVDPVLQDMLTAGGRDQLAVHDALAGTDGKTPNDRFIGDLMSHQWADDGAAAGSLLHGTAPIANPTDLNDPTQKAQAIMAGETMHAVDQYAGSNAGDLLNLPGTDGQSLGQVNPELTRALAEANRPFIDDMVGNNLDHTLGFGTLEDQTLNTEMPLTRDLFAVLDTDPKAAEALNSQAYLNDLQYQHRFDQSIINHDTPTTGDLQSAGTLRGLIDTSSNIAANDTISDHNAAAQQAYENRGQWLDVAKSVGEKIPGVGEILDGQPGDSLHDMLVGAAPTSDGPAHIAVSSSDALQHSIAQQLINARIGNPSVFEDLIDPSTHQLKPLEGMRANDLSQLRGFLDTYFQGIDPVIKTGLERYHDGYTGALPTAPGHTGG